MVRQLVNHKTRGATDVLRQSLRLAWHRRWWALLSCAVQRETAATLTKRQHHKAFDDADCPDDYELLDYARAAPAVSLLM